MLLINLAVSDLMLMMMIPMFIYNSFMQGPAFGRIGKSNGPIRLTERVMNEFFQVAQSMDFSAV